LNRESGAGFGKAAVHGQREFANVGSDHAREPPTERSIEKRKLSVQQLAKGWRPKTRFEAINLAF
jgi:hypothetical protein